MANQVGLGSVEKIRVEDTYALRLLVLRPGGKLSDCYFDGDQDLSTFHLGVRLDGEIVSVASFMQQKHKLLPQKSSIQLRGMATHPSLQGKGYGKLLVNESLNLAKSSAYQLMWCNARIIALSFYENLGFQVIGQPFEIGQIGVHYLMWQSIID